MTKGLIISLAIISLFTAMSSRIFAEDDFVKSLQDKKAAIGKSAAATNSTPLTKDNREGNSPLLKPAIPLENVRIEESKPTATTHNPSTAESQSARQGHDTLKSSILRSSSQGKETIRRQTIETICVGDLIVGRRVTTKCQKFWFRGGFAATVEPGIPGATELCVESKSNVPVGTIFKKMRVKSLLAGSIFCELIP